MLSRALASGRMQLGLPRLGAAVVACVAPPGVIKLSMRLPLLPRPLFGRHYLSLNMSRPDVYRHYLR